MADKPPVNRPPGPGGALPGHAAEGSVCYPSGATMGDFIDRLRSVLHNEWTRVRGGAPLDSNVEMKLTNELLTSFSVGKVIPGYRPNAQGACEMHWNEFACFARWYSLLSEGQRNDALDAFSYGVRTPWTEEGEYAWPPAPAPCDAGSADREAEWCSQYTDEGVCKNQWCCPPEVYEDPVYAGGSSKSSDSTKWIALGLGAIVAAGAVALLISQAEPDYVVEQ